MILKFINIDSDGHRQQILIIPASFEHLTEEVFQITQGSNTVNSANGFKVYYQTGMAERFPAMERKLKEAFTSPSPIVLLPVPEHMM